jgi:hypothetical protein
MSIESPGNPGNADNRSGDPDIIDSRGDAADQPQSPDLDDARRAQFALLNSMARAEDPESGQLDGLLQDARQMADQWLASQA